MKLRELKLKHQIIIIISFAAILICAIQIFYYYSFSRLTQVRTTSYEKKIIEQAHTKVNSILKDISVNAEIITSDRKLQEFVISNDYSARNTVLGPHVLDLIDYVKAFTSNVYSIEIEDNQGRTLYSLSNSDSFIYASKQFTEFMDSYRSEIDRKKTCKFTSIMKERSTGKNFFFYIAPVIETIGGVNYSERIAFCTIIISTDKIDEMIGNSELTPNSSLLIVDDKNIVISSNDTSKKGKKFAITLPADIDSLIGGFKTDINGEEVIIQQKKLELAPGWRIVSIIPVNELYSDMKTIKNTGIVVGMGMIITLLILGYFFFNNITQPIFKLITEMKKIGERKIGYRLNVYSTNEVGILATEINDMINKIEEMTRNIFNTQTRLYETELNKRKAEFSALQSQINPHFLYNTLNCISSIGLAYGSKEIVQITSSMSKIFRYSIRKEELVSICEEIDCVSAYINIISIRYANRFLIKVKVEEELLDKKTPKMILQPIVENSVYHGLGGIEEGGRLDIYGFIDNNGDVCFEVSDSGCGIEKNELKRIRNKLDMESGEVQPGCPGEKSIGLVNINNRISLLFGDGYGISIESKAGIGTTVRIKIPLL